MKNFFIYIVSVFLLTACASGSDDILDTPLQGSEGSEQPPVDEPWPWPEGVSVSVPDVEFYGDEGETRALAFDYVNKIMKFTWTPSTSTDGANDKNGDCIGVYPTKASGLPLDAEHSSQQRFVLRPGELTVEGNSVTGSFESYSEGLRHLKEKNSLYYAVAPYVDTKQDEHYDAYPISYKDQKQSVNVNMNAYFKKTNAAEMATYKASETAASAHLTDYDYLVSSATSTEDGSAHFFFTRLGAVVRFYLKVPEAIVYDSLHLVNTKVKFMTEGTMNIATQQLTTTKSSHQVCLKLGETGFDITNQEGPAWRQDVSPKVGYVVAYMMFAPIDLKTDTSIPACSLYLTGHTTDEPSVRKYYRADNLTRINIMQDKVQQWAPTTGPDEPITFQAISVEEWKSATYSNGDDGKGTEGW